MHPCWSSSHPTSTTHLTHLKEEKPPPYFKNFFQKQTGAGGRAGKLELTGTFRWGRQNYLLKMAGNACCTYRHCKTWNSGTAQAHPPPSHPCVHHVSHPSHLSSLISSIISTTFPLLDLPRLVTPPPLTGPRLIQADLDSWTGTHACSFPCWLLVDPDLGGTFIVDTVGVVEEGSPWTIIGHSLPLCLCPRNLPLPLVLLFLFSPACLPTHLPRPPAPTGGTFPCGRWPSPDRVGYPAQVNIVGLPSQVV